MNEVIFKYNSKKVSRWHKFWIVTCVAIVLNIFLGGGVALLDIALFWGLLVELKKSRSQLKHIHNALILNASGIHFEDKAPIQWDNVVVATSRQFLFTKTLVISWKDPSCGFKNKRLVLPVGSFEEAPDYVLDTINTYCQHVK